MLIGDTLVVLDSLNVSQVDGASWVESGVVVESVQRRKKRKLATNQCEFARAYEQKVNETENVPEGSLLEELVLELASLLSNKVEPVKSGGVGIGTTNPDKVLAWLVEANVNLGLAGSSGDGVNSKVLILVDDVLEL